MLAKLQPEYTRELASFAVSSRDAAGNPKDPTFTEIVTHLVRWEKALGAAPGSGSRVQSLVEGPTETVPPVTSTVGDQQCVGGDSSGPATGFGGSGTFGPQGGFGGHSGYGQHGHGGGYNGGQQGGQ